MLRRSAGMLATGIALLLTVNTVRAHADVQLQEVVVTATKTEKKPQDLTQSVTIINADDISKSGATTVAEIIGTAAGVTETDQGTPGSLQAITIRGSSYQQVLVLLDGKRLNSASAGGFDMSELPVPLNAIERIEIVRGPSSSLYGADAVGGVINIITKKPTATATTLGGSLGRAGYTSATLYNTGRDGALYYALSAGKERSHGYRTNSDLDKITAGIKLGYDLDATSSIEASSDYLTKDIGVPGSVLFASPHARQQNRLAITGLQYRQRLSQSFDFNVRAYESEEFLGFQDPDFAVSSRSRVATSGAEAQANWIMNTWNVISIGSEGRESRLVDADFGTHNASVSAEYVQDEMSIGDSFILVLGEREDHHSSFGSKLSPKASGRYLFSSTGTILRASYGESFRAPTFNDLFFFDAFGDRGNPDLKPEIAREYEGGIEQPFGTGNSVKFTAFRRRVSDLISWQTNSVFVSTAANIGRAQITGTEAELRFSMSKIVSGTVNYTRMFPVDETNGDRLLTVNSHIPDTGLGGSLQFALDQQTSLAFDGRWVKNYVLSSEEPWEYYVVNGKISETVSYGKDLKVNYYVGMKNMFNREYETVKGYPMPPAELYGGISAQF